MQQQILFSLQIRPVTLPKACFILAFILFSSTLILLPTWWTNCLNCLPLKAVKTTSKPKCPTWRIDFFSKGNYGREWLIWMMRKLAYCALYIVTCLSVLIYSCNSFNAHRRLILLCVCVCVVEEEGGGICVWVGCWMDECACVWISCSWQINTHI